MDIEVLAEIIGKIPALMAAHFGKKIDITEQELSFSEWQKIYEIALVGSELEKIARKKIGELCDTEPGGLAYLESIEDEESPDGFLYELLQNPPKISDLPQAIRNTNLPLKEWVEIYSSTKNGQPLQILALEKIAEFLC